MRLTVCEYLGESDYCHFWLVLVRPKATSHARSLVLFGVQTGQLSKGATKKRSKSNVVKGCRGEISSPNKIQHNKGSRIFKLCLPPARRLPSSLPPPCCCPHYTCTLHEGCPAQSQGTVLCRSYHLSSSPPTSGSPSSHRPLFSSGVVVYLASAVDGLMFGADGLTTV